LHYNREEQRYSVPLFSHRMSNQVIDNYDLDAHTCIRDVACRRRMGMCIQKCDVMFVESMFFKVNCASHKVVFW